MASNAPHPSFADYATEAVPQASVGSPGKDGILRLRFAPTDGRTALVEDYARAPFHLSGTLAHDPHDDVATVFVQSATGGIAQGDRHDVTIDVDPGAFAHVSTQSSTKVQSMQHNYGAAELRLSVGQGGYLEYLPEPTILHADARFHQDLTVELAPESIAVLGDIVVPGRLARGERFEFERYRTRVRVRNRDRLLFEDTTHLAPEEGDPTAPGLFGDASVYGTLFVVAPEREIDALSTSLHDAVSGCTARAAATELPNEAGVVVRALGDRAETVDAALHAAWDRARSTLLGASAPVGRKC